MWRIFSFMTIGFVLLPLQSAISLSIPIVSTNEAVFDDSNFSVTLSGTVNANGLPTTTWFEYGTASSTYNYTTSAQSLEGSSDTIISDNLMIYTLPYTTGDIYTYYYRIAAQNSVGIAYGNEKSFQTGFHGDPGPTPSPTLSTTPTPPYHVDTFIAGKVIDALFNISIPNALVMTDVGGYIVTTDSNGYYIISGLSVIAGETEAYILTAQADGYYPSGPQLVTLSENGINGKTDFELFPIQTTPTSTPTPEECLAESLEVSQKRLVIKRGKSKEITVILRGENCSVEGESIVANVSSIGFGRVSLSETSAVTNNEGEAVFSITAEKLGKSRIIFEAGNLKKSIIIKITRQ